MLEKWSAFLKQTLEDQYKPPDSNIRKKDNSIRRQTYREEAGREHGQDRKWN